MEWLRSCYSSSWQLTRGGFPTPGHFYFADPGTPHYPAPHTRWSRNWISDEQDGFTLGEVPGARQVWFRGSWNGPKPPARRVGDQDCIQFGSTITLDQVPGGSLVQGVDSRCWQTEAAPTPCEGAMIEDIVGINPNVDVKDVCNLTFGNFLVVQPLGGNAARVDVANVNPGSLLGRGAFDVVGPPVELALGSGLNMVGRVLSATPPAQPVATRVYNSAGFAPGGPNYTLTFDTVDYDYGLQYSGTTPSRLTANFPGVYHAGARAGLSVLGSVGQPLAVDLTLTKNGTTLVAWSRQALTGVGNSYFVIVEVEVDVQLATGDYLEVSVASSGTGVGLATITGNFGVAYPAFWMHSVLNLSPP